MKKLIILDYTTGEAHCYTYDAVKHPESEDVERLIETLGHSVNNCNWMTSDQEIIIH
jgi:hypothetical protein